MLGICLVIMKKFLFNAFGFGSPADFTVGTILVLVGLITLGDGQIGIQATPTSEVNWITAFAALPNWFGWMFVWLGFDSFFDGKLTRLFVNPVARAVVGEERLKRTPTKLEGRDKIAE